MEKATPEERMLRIIEAGVDQFGGESIPEMLIQLVNDKKVSEARLDSSVRRILRLKFQLGLFDDPFVNVENAEVTVGREEFVQAGLDAQRKSVVLLKNDSIESGRILPLKKGLKIYVENIDPAKLVLFGTVVNKPEDADVAIIRLKAPGERLKGSGLLGWMFNSGDLSYKGKEKTKILKTIHSLPAVVDIYLDRPAVIPEIALASRALTVNFGVSDEALLDVIFGNQKPYGRLPLELPSSMTAVGKQYEDVPYDSENPLFPFGFGLTY
jgi:beta-glucosidase